MTDDRSLDRAARSWLEEGPTRAPDRPVEAALARIQTTRQERDLRIPWRFPTMNPLGKFALAAAIGVIVVGAGLSLTGQLTGPGDQPTAVPSASVAPSLDLAAFTRRGTYVGPTLQVADIVATVNADASLTAADRTQIIDQFLAVRGKETLSISIDFYGGQLTQRETVNATTVVGSFGSYAFPDDHTLIYTESIDGEDVVTEFDISVNGDSFTLHRTTPAHGAADEFVTRLIFESGPFVLR